MKRIYLLMGVLFLTGCGRGLESIIMSGADVKQAEALIQANDLKMCSDVRLDGGFWSFNGSGRAIMALGKNLDYAACFKSLNPGMAVEFPRSD